MKKKVSLIMAVFAALAVSVVGFAACSASSENELKGNISLAGSTSMEKLAEALMESFMEEQTRITVTTQYTGSGAGLEQLVSKNIDIANSSRHVKDEEKKKGAVENVIALDGIAVIVNNENSVSNLSLDELSMIYTGQIKNWSELSGNDEAIVVIGRENSSGTRDAFEELLDVKNQCNYAQELDSTGSVLAKVSSTSGAIGYVSLDTVNDSVKSVKLDNVVASEENIINGSYKLQRPFIMATLGEIDEQNELVQAWFSYVYSDSGKEVIKEVGLINVV